MNDSGNGLSSAESLGSPGGVSNSQCTVSWGSGAVSGSGSTLSLTLNLTFNAGFAGNRVIYVAARDVNEANNTDWHAMATWTVQ